MQGSRDNMISAISRRRFVVASGVSGLMLGRALNAGDESADADMPPVVVEHPLVPAIKHARACLDKVLQMRGYQCEFTKKEVVGRQTITQTMRMKVREEPFSVYMYFLEPHEGREVIFVEGRNNNKLLVHETGLASLIGTLELDPTSSQVMAENRYPVTKAGIANMLRTVIEQWEAETTYAETDVKYFEDAKIGNVACRVIESSHPRPRKQFNFHITRLWIEVESGLGVRVQQFGFPKSRDAKPPLIEDYTFSKIKSEVRLTDRDFDPENPSYNY